MITAAAEILPDRESGQKAEFPYLATGLYTGTLYLITGADVSSRIGDPYYKAVVLVPANVAYSVGESTVQCGGALKKIKGSVKIVLTSE